MQTQTLPIRAPQPCPLCGGTLTIDAATTVETYHPGYHVKGTPLPTRERACIAAACNGCEFMIELN